MKKRILAILLSGILLSGCAASEPPAVQAPAVPAAREPSVQPQPREEAAAAPVPSGLTETPEPGALPAGESLDGYTLTASPAPERPARYLVTVKSRGGAKSHEDGTLLASCRFDLPWMTAYDAADMPLDDDPAAALFNQQFESWIVDENFEETCRFALEHYENRLSYGEASWEPYTEELNCTVYQTDRLVSVAGTCWSYTGGAHGNTSLLSWNFDLEEGGFFSVPSLSDDPAAFSQAVTEELIRQAQTTLAEGTDADWPLTLAEIYWEDYQTILADWSSYAVSFDGEGMTVAFSPYELAAYAAGPQVFCLPYSFLEPYLSEGGRALLGLPAPDAVKPMPGEVR